MAMAVEMAPVIPRDRWRSVNGKLYMQCPLCHRRYWLPHKIVDSFTEGGCRCPNPHCYFFDWVRLEGWDEDE